MNKALLSATIAGMLTAGIAVSAGANGDPAMTGAKEKCYGISKTGQNSCKTPSHSCAGQSTKDNDPNDWTLISPEGCKSAGGSTQPPSS